MRLIILMSILFTVVLASCASRPDAQTEAQTTLRRELTAASATIAIQRAQIIQLEAQLAKRPIDHGQRTIALEELQRLHPAAVQAVRDAIGDGIHPSRMPSESFDGDDLTSAIFHPQGGFVEARYETPRATATMVLVGRTDATNDLITAGSVVINNTLEIPIRLPFGRLEGQTTCLIIPLERVTKITSIRVTSTQGVNLPGIAEIRLLDANQKIPVKPATIPGTTF